MQTPDKPLRYVLEQNTLTVYLEGDIDHHSAATVRSRLDSMLYLQHPGTLVLELSRVAFMDSAGLGLILGRLAKATELGISLQISNPNRQVAKILELAGLERLVPILFDTAACVPKSTT